MPAAVRYSDLPTTSSGKAAPQPAGISVVAACASHCGTEQMSDSVLPVIDLGSFLASGDTSVARAVADLLAETGCLVVRDPRVQQQDNDTFLNTMETYFDRPDKAQDTRPELSYQVGATPEGTERPRILSDPAMRRGVEQMPDASKPALPNGPDVKWRFMWRVGPRPAATAYPELNAEPVVPAGIPGWAETLDGWGCKMLAAAEAVAELAAVGFGLDRRAFVERMQHGPHLLSPTGVDLQKHGQLGTVYAGYHYDLNFLTIHGKSRFPGLYVWLRDGRRVAVRIPDGCLLLQAGKQLEWLTGGTVQAGMHEVVCTPATQAAAADAAAAGLPVWRVSSTVFSHIASDQPLQPLGRFATPDTVAAYPALPAGDYVQQELRTIKLSGN